VSVRNTLVFLPVSLRIDVRTVRFLDRFNASENSLCNVFREQASRHMSEFSIFGVPELSSWCLLRLTRCDV